MMISDIESAETNGNGGNTEGKERGTEGFVKI
jgi:hypothetical protein